MTEAKKARYKKLAIGGASGDVTVYATPRILSALSEATINMDLYQGVKLSQVIDAVYAQGKKDGRREMFEGLGKSVKQLAKDLPHMNPGRPRKPKK